MNEYTLQIDNTHYMMFDCLNITAHNDDSAMMHARSLSFLLLEGTVLTVSQGSGDSKRIIGSVTNKEVMEEVRKKYTTNIA